MNTDTGTVGVDCLLTVVVAHGYYVLRLPPAASYDDENLRFLKLRWLLRKKPKSIKMKPIQL